jgi:hypothetical protein
MAEIKDALRQVIAERESVEVLANRINIWNAEFEKIHPEISRTIAIREEAALSPVVIS